MADYHCIACGYHRTYPIYQPEDQPLAALYLPKDAAEARNVPRLPMDFRMCASCGHIFNVRFSYDKVPYEDNSNLMYNAGSGWQTYMKELVADIAGRYQAAGKTFIDIGCGDGGFLKLLRTKIPDGRFIGYEPGIEAANARKDGLEVYKEYFVAERHLPEHRPDFLICRHVIEHLEQPRDFIAEIACQANRHDVFPLFIAEVPRIDKAVRDARINDYLYEHVSNFTHYSFRNMFEQAGYEVLDQQAAYGDEVVIIIARPKKTERLAEIERDAKSYHSRIQEQLASVKQTLERLKREGKDVAFWGGTGKGAAFLNAFQVEAESFPLVVDSDPNKVGRFVPGTGQEIRPPEYLNEHPAHVIIVTTQWRAKDIYEEIQRRGIACEQVLVLIGQELKPYTGEEI